MRINKSGIAQTVFLIIISMGYSKEKANEGKEIINPLFSIGVGRTGEATETLECVRSLGKPCILTPGSISANSKSFPCQACF